MHPLQVRTILMMPSSAIIDEFWAILDCFTDEEYARLTLMGNAMLP